MAKCMLEYLIESLVMQTQSNKCQKKYTIAQKVVYGDYNTVDHLRKVANLSFLVPWHSGNETKDFHHFAYAWQTL